MKPIKPHLLITMRDVFISSNIACIIVHCGAHARLCGKTCACGSSTCLKNAWVSRSTFNLHRAGSYCTFSTLVKVYPHKTFFTRGSKKALQKPVLRGEKGGGAAASIWRIEQAISHQPCLIITNRSADDSV